MTRGARALIGGSSRSTGWDTSRLVASALSAVVSAAVVVLAREHDGLAIVFPFFERFATGIPIAGLLTILSTIVVFWLALVMPSGMPAWLRRGLTAGTYVAALAIVLLGALGALGGGDDARVLYDHRLPDPYDASYLAYGFIYTPAVAQLVYPFVQLPWPLFLGLWTGLLLVAMARMAGPAAPLLMLAPLVALDVWYGNVNLLLAYAIVLGSRWPATWSLILLTKITPAVGLLWFVVRRDHRSLVIALGATSLIVLVSVLLAPGLWGAWFTALTTTQAPARTEIAPLALRLPIAAAIVVVGALRAKPWVLPVAALVALPVLWPGAVTLLIGAIPLARRAGQPGRRSVDYAVPGSGI